VKLPPADDLFRATAPLAEYQVSGEQDDGQAQNSQEEFGPDRRPSGRVRHDEKMTIYVTSDELFDIEQARLVLRRTHGQAVDRGRLVREAVAMALADLEQNGSDSVLVQRLTGP